MSRFARGLRQTLTIARRDFTATVFTPIFLLFLFAPVMMLGFSAIGGLGAASVADSGRDRAAIVAIVPDALARPIAEADTRLRAVFPRDAAPPPLATVRPAGEPGAQTARLFQTKDMDVGAVMFGPLERPHVLYARRFTRSADYLALVAAETLVDQRLGAARPRVDAVKIATDPPRTSQGSRNQAAFVAVFGVFFLTLFLSGQVIGTMAEERNTKVIEVLAAAVPLECVFLGKLLGMFGVAVLFVCFWGVVVSQVAAVLPPGAAAAIGQFAPAVGGSWFAALFAAYFAMAYLLLGSVFLGIGSQASTMREIQLLSLPVTIVQVGMFALSSAAAAHPGGWLATATEVFPLSSPYAMAGHAANAPELWPHALALGWQGLWVAAFITVGARAFRRGVLQSGSARPRRSRKALQNGRDIPIWDA